VVLPTVPVRIGQTPFDEYFLADLDGDKVDQLKDFLQVRGRS
jgi:hypothetical protein